MPITEQQREARKHHVGSSDMAAILGLDPFKTAYDVWLEKKGRLVDRPPSEVMKAGSRFEDGVLDFAEEQLGPLSRNVSKPVEGTPLATNIDALVKETEEPVEGKTVGLYGPVREWWGQERTDQVPDRVIVQSHVHMMAVSAQVCHVAAFIGGRGFAMFAVPRNDKLVEIVRERATAFWHENVEADQPPEGSRASLEVVKLVRREAEKVVSIDPHIVENWLMANGVASDAIKAKKKAEAAVLEALGDAEAGLCGDLGAVTYLETQRKGYTAKATTFRTLRHRKKGL